MTLESNLLCEEDIRKMECSKKDRTDEITFKNSFFNLQYCVITLHFMPNFGIIFMDRLIQ